jgi:hypothetical protein
VKDDFVAKYGGGKASTAAPNSLNKEFGYWMFWVWLLMIYGLLFVIVLCCLKKAHVVWSLLLQA